MNRHKRFREMFRFQEYILLESLKIACRHSQQLQYTRTRDFF